ncbi:MAG: glycogen-binding domain-containing protein, partial [Bacteroidia bacterium]
MPSSVVKILKWTIPLLLLLGCAKHITKPLTYRIEGSKLIFEFTGDDLRRFTKGNYSDLDAFKERIKIQLESNDSLDFGSADGWNFVQVDTNLFQLVKDLAALEGCLEYDHKMMLKSFFIDDDYSYTVNQFGYLSTKPENIFKTDSSYIFYLPAFYNANKVMLSGNFNNWNTLDNKMQKTDSGWVTHVKLAVGKYEYKFIVDGTWTEDPYNENTVLNKHGSYNSIMVVPNYTFSYAAGNQNKSVVLSGNFVDWD